jgi:hypothetical protein
MKNWMLIVFFLTVCEAVFAQEQTATTENQTTVTDKRKSELEALLSNKTLEGNYYRTASILSLGDQELLGGINLTEDNDVFLKGGLSTHVLQKKTPLDIDIGARIYLSFVKEPDDDIIGLAAGIRGRYELKISERFPIALASSIYYAPEIVTSGSNIDILDVEPIRAEVGLTSNIKAIAGFRVLEVGDKSLDNLFNLGASFRF